MDYNSQLIIGEEKKTNLNKADERKNTNIIPKSDQEKLNEEVSNNNVNEESVEEESNTFREFAYEIGFLFESAP